MTAGPSLPMTSSAPGTCCSAGRTPSFASIRKAWYRNLDRVTTNGDNEAIFHVNRPQLALLALLASGYSPVYPCHVSPRDMRTHPIGTGPFKFVEFKPNERITLGRNPDYCKPGRPYLDGIEARYARSPAPRGPILFHG